MAKSHEPAGEIFLYQTEDGRTRVECRFADESLWLSQALMAELRSEERRVWEDCIFRGLPDP